MDNFSSEKIMDHVYLHTLKTNKFKTNLINFYFERPLLREEVTYNPLIPMVLQRGTEKYSTSKEIYMETERLFGSYIGGNISKKGDRQIIQFSLISPNEEIVKERGLFSNSVELLKEVILHPKLENKGFLKTYVEQEKKNLKNRILGRVNDKMKYALDRCIEEMFQGQNYALYEYGNIDDLEKINSYSLLDHYKKVINDSSLNIVFIGNMDHHSLKPILSDKLPFGKNEGLDVIEESEDKSNRQVKLITEEMDVSQGKLTLGYRTNIHYLNSLYPALMVYSSILGGGAHSKLFLKVREEESLCYYIFSRLDKFKSLMLISCGIEIDRYESAKEKIEIQLEEMKKGNITRQEMEDGKKAIITTIQGIGDNPSSLADYMFSQMISEEEFNPDRLIKKIRAVTKEELVEVADKIYLDTVYFLKSK